MKLTAYRPDPPDGPWILDLEDGAIRFWSPDPASRAELERAAGSADAIRLDARLEGGELEIERVLETW